MKIKEIISQYRRDFTAIYECEHCGKTTGEMSGYDDDHFHRNVIPDWICKHCGCKAAETYRPLATKYAASAII